MKLQQLKLQHKNIASILSKLLQDKTTKANILWGTDAYKDLEPEYGRYKEITTDLITADKFRVIKNRSRKALEQQNQRVRQHAEVFTPLWICKKMNDFADEVWFGAPDRFSKDGMPTDKVKFTKRKHWRLYVNARRMEITCGEAPYLVSRYDVLSGEYIPLENRIGLLDRKLRVVNENVDNEADWLFWVKRAFQSIYGYEFQGDNLLIARVNMMMTFEEYMVNRWKRKPTPEEYEEMADIIAWNLWQMDGLTNTVPYDKKENYDPITLKESASTLQQDPQEWIKAKETQQKGEPQYCKIRNWWQAHNLEFRHVTKGKRKMKFDFIIGNPPYQDETVGDNKTYAAPIYNEFLDGAYEIGQHVILIHPARFLFNAGSTPKDWNKKMLEDEHLKILYYDPNSANLFPNTDIKGGIAITYRDANKSFGKIGHFIVFDELRSINNKVKTTPDNSLSQIIYPSESFKFAEKMHEEHPDIEKLLSKGHKYDFKTSVLSKLDDKIFFTTIPNDEEKYIEIIGLIKGNRVTRYIRLDYIQESENFKNYKVFVPKANGSGALGEVLSTPLIGQPLIGHTQSFISIGNFKTESEASAAMKYIKTKFARVLLGILKITQDNPPEKWRYIPLQDFTFNSDIDWSKSIAEIDQQLYKKYGLNEKEINFIETHVKEMA